jgi:hypothetical protein
MTLMTIAIVAAAAAVFAQTPAPARSPSPDGIASVQVGEWKADDKPGARVANGKWIEILYGRPLKRGRTDLFGSGETYGTALKGGAAVWRAGANVLTRLRTEVPLVIGGKTVPPGEYTLFIDMKARTDWTLIVSSQPAQAADDVPARSKVWEAFVYAPEKGRRSGADARRAITLFNGTTDVCLHRCHRRRRDAEADVGLGDGVGRIHRREVARETENLRRFSSHRRGRRPRRRAVGKPRVRRQSLVGACPVPG